MFSGLQDASIIAQMDAEHFFRYYTPKVWLVHNPTINKNLYGEPGTVILGADGVTSLKTTRQLSSASSDFITAGVGVNDVLEVYKADSGDFGRYLISTVNSLHIVTISADWPMGSLTGLNFRILAANERYVRAAAPIPFHVKLDPTEQELRKWGMEQKSEQKVDALLKLSILLCSRLGVTPKVGDRFDYTYNGVSRQYEVLTLIERDQITDSGIPMHYVGSATKTRDLY